MSHLLTAPAADRAAPSGSATRPHVTMSEARRFERNELPLARMREITAACDRCPQCALTVGLAVQLARGGA